MREDYSAYGTAGTIFPTITPAAAPTAGAKTASAASRDRHQYICFALALWNGKDPILKERLFGLTGNEGNHGEDVKEYYFYLDSTPTHSYMKFLYKYPQAAFPYARLVEENRRRGKRELEFELIDTGIFDDDRYFDVFVEYAKAGPDDILDSHRGDQSRPRSRADLHLLPTVWFRNTWSWGLDERRPRRQSRRDGRDRRDQVGLISITATAGFTAKAVRSCCLPKTRPTSSDFLASENSVAVRQRRHQRLYRPRR